MHIPSMSNQDIEFARRLEEELLQLEQLKLTTKHTIHGGIYSRTITMVEGQALTGAVIVVPTMLYVSGRLKIQTGGEIIEIDGTEVIPAGAGRKQAMYAVEETTITMSFATNAKTVKEAEDEFTSEPERLISRLDESINFINITGE